MSHSVSVSNDKRDAEELSANVSEDLIRAALESVERGAGGVGGLAAEVAADPSPAERELAEVRAQLDLSVTRARETLDRLKDTHERYLRAAADLDNFKKRAAREREEAERFGVQRLLKDLLPVLDNLERALAHVDVKNPLAEGVLATRRMFEEAIGRYGVKSFTALGQPFDPNKHEAMQQLETSEVPPGTVVAEMVRGYLLHDRLIRPALVTVSAAPPVSNRATAAAGVSGPATDPGEGAA